MKSMKIIFNMGISWGLSIISLLIFFSTSSAKEIKINHFKNGEQVSYANPGTALEVSRFLISGDVELKEISFSLSGGKGGGRMMIFGNEFGSEVPMSEDLISGPHDFKKNKSGYQKITIDMGYLPIKGGKGGEGGEGGQIFVVFEFDNKRVKLVASNRVIPPLCSDVDGGMFSAGLVKKINGDWKLIKHAFDVEITLDEIEHEEEPVFSLIEISDELDSLNLRNSSILSADYDGDGFNDLLLGDKLFKNNKNFEFVLDTNIVLASGVNVFSDINNDSQLDVLNFSENKIFEHENLSGEFNITDSIDFPFQKIFSFSVADFDGDKDLDLVVLSSDYNSENKVSAKFIVNNKGKLFLNENILESDLFSKNARLSLSYADDLPNVLITSDSVPFLIFENRDDFIFEMLENKDVYSIKQNSPKTISSNFSEVTSGVLIKNMDEKIDDNNLENNYKTNQKLMLRESEYFFNDKQFADIKHNSSLLTDLDLDGEMELVLTPNCDCHKSRIYKKSDGKWEEIENTGIENYFGRSPLFSDLNGDGFPEIIAEQNGKIIIFKQNPRNENQNNKIKFSGFPPGTKVKYDSEEEEIRYLHSSGQGEMVQGAFDFFIGLKDKEGSIDSLYVQEPGGKTILLENIEGGRIVLKSHTAQGSESEQLFAQMSPNPFRENLKIDLNIVENGQYKITITNSESKIIKILHDGFLDSGALIFVWNGKDKADTEIATGVYMLNIISGKQTHISKIIKIN
jgi:FG-GAP-like repeat